MCLGKKKSRADFKIDCHKGQQGVRQCKSLGMLALPAGKVVQVDDISVVIVRFLAEGMTN